MSQKILQPGEIEQFAGGEIPFLRLPGRLSVFPDRARRLRQLAAGHAMGDYLEFMATLAEAQHWSLENLSAVPIPKPEHVALCREHGMPPLNVQDHPRDRVWCDALRRMLLRLSGQTEGKVSEIATRLAGERDELYEAQASKLLAGITLGLDLGYAPLIGAGLQVYWTHMANMLGLDAYGRTGALSVCPCCGSRPLASVVRIGAQAGGNRYLHCSVCASEWHMVRIMCTSCESTRDISYHGIEGGSRAVQAEGCDECCTYLKIFNMERDPHIEPTADDLASTALDLLMDATGKLRSGQNLMLIQGEARD